MKDKAVPQNQIGVVFISGIFNILHPGHLRMFKFAAELGERVVVGLRAASTVSHDVLSDSERIQALEMVSLVDEVRLMTSLPDLLEEIKPKIVLKGSEFRNLENIETDIISAWHGEVVFSSGESQFNSLQFMPNGYHQPLLEFPQSYIQFVKRHNINTEHLRESLTKVKGLRVAVIGDTIVDEYVNCDPVGLSREDPTIVVTPTEQNYFVGGAAIVALHSAAMGATVDFYSVCGEDDRADWLESELAEHGVGSYLIRDKSRPTTLKKRYRCDGKTLLRVNEFRSHALNKKANADFLRHFRDNIHLYDLLVFSDFSYGLLSSETAAQLQDIARQHNVMMVADSQTSSQKGDLSKFLDQTLITPTEIEARSAANILDNDVGLAVVIEKLAEKLNAEGVVITLGSEGALILDNSADSPQLDSLPALNKHPVDVSGAGDILLITSSLFKKVGCDLWHAVFMGMIASAIHIKSVGNKPVALDEIADYIGQI